MENLAFEKIDKLAEQATLLMVDYQEKLDGLMAQTHDELDAVLALQQEKFVEFINKNAKEEMNAVKTAYINDIAHAREQMLQQVTAINANFNETSTRTKQLIFRSWMVVSISAFVCAVVLIAAIWLAADYKKTIQTSRNEIQRLSVIGQSDIIRCCNAFCTRVNKNKDKDGYQEIKKR